MLAACVPRRGENTNVNAAVVGDLLGDFERLREVLLGLAREADDDVGAQRHVGHVLADHRDAIEVAAAVIRAAHRLQDPRLEPDCSGRWMCSHTLASSAWARITSSRMSFGCGLV